MDNLFSSSALFSFLRFCGYSAMGTIRDNRIPKSSKSTLTNKTLFKQKSRGYFETAIEKNKWTIIFAIDGQCSCDYDFFFV